MMSAMISPLCLLRELLDWPRATVQGRPIISGHRYQEQEPEDGQACCVQVLKCMACGDVQIGWKTCTCKQVRRDERNRR